MECAGKPVRILEILPTSNPGGAAKHVWDLMRHLPKEEFEPVIAAPRDGVLFDRFRDLGFRVVEFPRHKMGARHLLLATRLISTLAIDIVHTHGKEPGLYGRLAAGWSRVPAIHTLHAVYCSARPPLGQRLYLVLERGLARRSHTIITVSTSQKVEASALRLVSDPVRRKTMGERGRRRAHQDFAVRAMVDATAQVYRQAVSRRHRSRFERAAVGQFPRVGV